MYYDDGLMNTVNHCKKKYTFKRMVEFWRLELNLIPLKQCVICTLSESCILSVCTGLTSKSLALTGCDILGACPGDQTARILVLAHGIYVKCCSLSTFS